MWPHRGVVVLNGSRAGVWMHLTNYSMGRSVTPTTHVESTRGRSRVPYMQVMLLSTLLREARALAPQPPTRSADTMGDTGKSQGRCPSRVLYIELPGNRTVDLIGEPTVQPL